MTAQRAFSPIAIRLVLVFLAANFVACALPVGRSPAPGRPPPEPSMDWLSQVQSRLAAREYPASDTRRGLQAPNRRHGLRIWFEPAGIRVADRAAPGNPELLGLQLRAHGRGAELAEDGRGGVSHEGPRVEIARPEPGFILSVAAGAGLLSLLDRRPR